ncbi:MAG: 1,4-alpha-glucan branching protein [Anaerolineae bacterium]|nr:1,4-alpha-glucan branching protein [Anaerolineae bacterium]
MIIHFDNNGHFDPASLLLRHGEQEPQLIAAAGQDAFGDYFDIPEADQWRQFKFGQAGTEGVEPVFEDDKQWRALPPSDERALYDVWARSQHAFVHTVEPAATAAQTASELTAELPFMAGAYITDTGGTFALGANVLQGGGVSFGFFHPHAARVYVTGDFNDWAYPGAESADERKFIEMSLHKGYFDLPNIWCARVENASPGDLYRFYVDYGALIREGDLGAKLTVDPYVRVFGADMERNDGMISDPSGFAWEDDDFDTTAIHDLLIYELHVHGFTYEHGDVPAQDQGRFAGVVDRIQAGYFDKLGITAIYLMPTAESPTPQGEHSMGYNTAGFMAIERDFGSPDDLRRLVNEAHKAGVSVILDQVFNHTANNFNPLWKLILDHPDEAEQGEEGGLYFSGETPWGNRVATERIEVQNLLIDTCKLFLKEYHVDGFRYDFTHSSLMDHGFMNRMADELQVVKPEVILIAENMPNEKDLNRQGFDGYGQWCDEYHDTIKALLREGIFEAETNDPRAIGSIFYFSKDKFAAHTNNVVNYCESHDENSVAFEVGTVETLNNPASKERKSRLGLFATIVALGQPMIYMGAEFGVERERNTAYYKAPENPDNSGFYSWASRLMRLRRRYPALKLHGYNPADDGQFGWIAGTWLDARHGAGRRVIGWWSRPTDDPLEAMVILINFENHSVEIDLELGIPGRWARLADIDFVNDLPPEGNYQIDHVETMTTGDGRFAGFTLPDSSGFIYKWIGG